MNKTYQLLQLIIPAITSQYQQLQATSLLVSIQHIYIKRVKFGEK